MKSTNRSLILSIVVILLGFLFLFLREVIKRVWGFANDDLSWELMSVIGGIFILAGFYTASFILTSRGINLRSVSEPLTSIKLKKKKTKQKAKKELDIDQSLPGVSPDYISEKTKTDIEVDSTEEGDLLKILNVSAGWKMVEEYSKEIERDIESHIQRLAKNSVYNLNFGVATFLGSALVAYVLWPDIDRNFANAYAFISYYGLRFFLLFFAEYFVVFFLKLYKNNLNDIKYFRDRMTEIRFKLLGLRVAYFLNEKESLGLVIDNITVSRNNENPLFQVVSNGHRDSANDSLNKSEFSNKLLNILKELKDIGSTGKS